MKQVIIFAGLVAGFLSLVMIMRQYIGVLLQGEGSTNSVVIHFNRYGELYWDGIALIGLLCVCGFALYLHFVEWVRWYRYA